MNSNNWLSRKLYPRCSPQLHQSIRLKFQFRQNSYSKTLFDQVLFNSPYFCSRIGLDFRNTKGKRAWRPEKTSEKFLFPTSIRLARVSSAYENGWQLSNGGGKGREERGGYLSPKLLQVSSQVIDSLLFCFQPLPPSPGKFPNFLWRKNHFVFLERNEELEYCLTEQCWIKKGISCLRHEGFCIFNGIALEEEVGGSRWNNVFQRMYHRCAWKLLLLLKFCYIS